MSRQLNRSRRWEKSCLTHIRCDLCSLCWVHQSLTNGLNRSRIQAVMKEVGLVFMALLVGSLGSSAW